MSALAAPRRTGGRGTRTPAGRGTKRPASEPTTLGDSPSLAPFRALLERFVRASGSEMHRLRTDVVADIRMSRYRNQCVNELIHECIHRGGPDGLVTAVEVLAQLDARVVLTEARRFLQIERPRWRSAVAVRDARARDITRHEVWYILLRAVCQTADYAPASFFVRTVLRDGPDSVREGIAAAISDLGDRHPERRPALKTLVAAILGGTRRLRDGRLSRPSRNALLDALHDLGA